MNKKLLVRAESLVLRKETLRRLDPSVMAELHGGRGNTTSNNCGGNPTSLTTCSAHTSRGG